MNDLEPNGQCPFVVPNQSENDIHNLISVWFNRFRNCFSDRCSSSSFGSYTLRKLVFHFISNRMGYDRGDSFPFDIELNGIPFSLKSKGKLSPRSYPIQFERKRKYSFPSAEQAGRVSYFRYRCWSCIDVSMIKSCGAGGDTTILESIRPDNIYVGRNFLTYIASGFH